MEILIGVIFAGATELVKEVSAKFGKKLTTAIIYGGLFVAALVYSYLQVKGFFNTEIWQQIVVIFSGAIATYEVLIKRVAQPLLKYKR